MAPEVVRRVQEKLKCGPKKLSTTAVAIELKETTPTAVDIVTLKPNPKKLRRDKINIYH